MRTWSLMALVMLVLGVALGGSALLGCGDGGDGGCYVPAGTYTMEFSDAGGDCDPSLVTGVTSVRRDHEVVEGEGDECASVTFTQTDESGVCAMEITFEADGTSNGMENGWARVEFYDCDAACTHEFNVYYELR